MADGGGLSAGQQLELDRRHGRLVEIQHADTGVGGDAEHVAIKAEGDLLRHAQGQGGECPLERGRQNGEEAQRSSASTRVDAVTITARAAISPASVMTRTPLPDQSMLRTGQASVTAPRRHKPRTRAP